MRQTTVSWALLALAAAALGASLAAPAAAKGDGKTTAKVAPPPRPPTSCPPEMAFVQARAASSRGPAAAAFCIDKWEAHTVELLPRGASRRHSPFLPVEGKKVKAVSAKGRVPQAYISRDQAEAACHNAGKRLCSDEEWVTACKGKRPTTYPYGDEWKPGRCNDSGFASFNDLFGGDGKAPPESAYTWDNLNDPRLNKPKGTAAPTGKFEKCKNSYRLHDMVGNLHEWTSAPSGTFRGGYYLDVQKNGPGCDYKTTAHNAKYHDYSTGFRCCK